MVNGQLFLHVSCSFNNHFRLKITQEIEFLQGPVRNGINAALQQAAGNLRTSDKCLQF